MLRPRLVCFIACVLVSVSLFAERPAIPTLSIEGDDGKVALDLVALQIRVTIRGHLARTEYELTYHNSLDRVIGGEFRFPLPADAEVSDLGLYFNGKLRHGVAVERVLARAAYEETVHRSVDPALAEWGSGRAFKLSVYPIPADGEKKIFIAYDQELTADGYTLDLRYGRPMKLDAAIDADGRTVTVEGSVPMHSDGQLVDGIVRVAREEQETALLAYSPEDKMWYASAAIDVQPSASVLPPAPHVVILYDTSSSSVQQNAPQLRRFLSAFLARQQAWATADVFPFHIALDTPRRIEKAGMPAGQRDVERVLGELQPLGATNLFAVISQLSAILAPLPPSTRIVLVTDGLTSLGDSRDVAAALRKLSDLRRPLLVVNAASTADDQVLANAARATGGWSIDLTRIDPEVAAANAMRLPANVRFGPGILPGHVVSAGGERVSIAARANSSVIALPHDLPPREIAENSMVRRAWARAKLREMLAEGATDDELVAHGRAFTQLTPRTSLLVLESWRDYLLYDIPMPPDAIEEKEREEREAEAQGQTTQLIAYQPPQFTPGSWFIKGHVFTDGDPLPGVTVGVRDDDRPLAVTVTDANGRYLLSHATAPAKPVIVAELSGFNRVERQLDPDTPAGTTIDISMTYASVSETITVTAEAPSFDPAGTESAAAVRPSIRTAVITTDELLNEIAAGTAGTEPDSDEDDPEVLDAVRKHRIELTQQVIAKLRGIGSTSERVRFYLSARALLGGDKAFHAFAAEVFRDRSPEIAARVLSDLAETRPDDAPVLRLLARVLDGWNEPELAKLLLQRAIEIAPTQPQSWRELLLLEAKHGRASSVAAIAKRIRATKKDDWSIKEIYDQVEEDLARFERQRGGDLRVDPQDDLRAELMWDSGWSWVDIHITEPNGEVVKWDHTESALGGRFTGGYIYGFGPEIYTIHNARPGDYRIDIDYYMSDDTNVSLQTLAHVIVYARGRRGRLERHEHFVVLQLDEEHRTLETVKMN